MWSWVRSALGPALIFALGSLGTLPSSAADGGAALKEFVQGIRESGYMPVGGSRDGFRAVGGWEVGRWIVVQDIRDPDLTSMEPQGQRYSLQNWSLIGTNQNVRALSAAWRTNEFGGDWKFAQIASVLQAADASVKWASTKNWVLDWGQLREETLDPEALSQLVLFSFFPTITNLPRIDIQSAEKLVPGRLRDGSEEPPSPTRPWVILKRLVASDLKVDFSKVRDFKLHAGAGLPTYGNVGLNLRHAAGQSNEFVLDSPMTLGFGAARLLSMKPRPPQPVTNDMATWQRLLEQEKLHPYSFEWEIAECVRGKPTTRIQTVANVTIERALQIAWIRAQDRSAAAALAGASVREAAEAAAKGSPVELAAMIEVASTNRSPGGKTEWRGIDGRSPAGVVYADEAVRLRVYLDQPAYVYVVNRDATDQMQVLSPKVEGEPNSFGSGKAWPVKWSRFPEVLEEKDDGGTVIDFFAFTDPGIETLQVIASTSPIPGFAQSLGKVCKSAREGKARVAGGELAAGQILADTPKLARRAGSSARFAAVAERPSDINLVLQQAAQGATTATVSFRVCASRAECK